MMRAILCCPPSSADIERLFSSATLAHTKLRNHLTNDKVAKLVDRKKKESARCPYSQTRERAEED